MTAGPVAIESGALRVRERRLGAAGVALLIAFGALLPIMHHGSIAGGKVNFCAADLVVVPVFFALRRQWWQSGAMGRWVLALWVVNLVSWMLSLDMLAPGAFLREFLKVAGCYLYLVVGYGIGRAAKAEPLFVKSLALASALIAVGAACAYVTGQPAAFIMDGRVVGSSTDPNGFAIFLAMQMPIVSSLGFAWLILPLYLAGGAVTLSRTGMVSMVISLFLSALHTGVKRLLLVAALCLLVAAGSWSMFAGNTLSRRVLQYETSLGSRQELWSLALATGTQHPLFGAGRGNWEVATGRKDIAHNTFLQVIADTGFVGLAVFMVPVVFWLGAGLRRRETRPWAIALLIGLVGGLAISLDNFRLFWLVIGALIAKLGLLARVARAPRPEMPQ
jgi:O-antigen ligase